MSINLNTVGISGTILFWLGIGVCVVSLALFIAVSTGITDGLVPERGSFDGTTTLTFHHSDCILIEWKDKLIFLMPVAAGIILTFSGMLIRSKASEYAKVIKTANGHYESSQYSPDVREHPSH